VVLQGLAARGLAVMVFTQKPRQALGYADEIVVARDGAVAGVHVAPNSGAEAGALGPAVLDEVLREMVDRPRPAADYAAPGAAVPDASLRDDVATGPAVAAGAAAPTTALLRIEGWTAHDPVDPLRPMVDGVDLVLHRGEIVGLAGLRESGAQAVLLSVYGRSEGAGASGAVFVDGQAVDTSTVEKAIAAGLFLASTDPPRYRVRFVGGIAMPVSASKLPGLVSMGLVDRDSDIAPGDGVADRMLGAVRGLSKGGPESEHIRGYVAAFAESERKVLMLGNPTSGMPEARRRELHAGLRGIAAAGKGVLLASDDLTELLELCDRVVVLANGRVTGEFARGAVPAPARLAAMLAPE